MKANELMIGDWVIAKVVVNSNGKTKPVVTKVTDILIDGINANYCGGELDDYIEEIALEPIPLTAEILKANGFKKVDLTIDNYALKLEEKGKYDVHTILWGGVFDGRMDLEFKVMGEHIHIDKKIRYVHELQHALRLCELSELADNFKVE